MVDGVQFDVTHLSDGPALPENLLRGIHHSPHGDRISLVPVLRDLLTGKVRAGCRYALSNLTCCSSYGIFCLT